jgi:hypothetical protein
VLEVLRDASAHQNKATPMQRAAAALWLNSVRQSYYLCDESFPGGRVFGVAVRTLRGGRRIHLFDPMRRRGLASACVFSHVRKPLGVLNLLPGDAHSDIALAKTIRLDYLYPALSGVLATSSVAIGGLLLRFLEATGLDRWPACTESTEVIATRAREFANGLELVRGVSGKGLFSWYDGPKSISELARNLENLPPGHTHARPYALVLGFADSFANRSLRFEASPSSSLLVEDYVSRPGWPSTRGPYIFLAVIGPSRLHGGTFACRSAALLPIASIASPLVVESHNEREVALSLLSTLGRHHSRWPNLALHKPLFAENVGTTVVRSDFCVSSGSTRMHVEVLGFDPKAAPEYHRTKRLQEQALLATGAVTHSVHAYACRSGAQWRTEFEALTKATETFIARTQPEPARSASGHPWPPDPEAMWKPLKVLESELPGT